MPRVKNIRNAKKRRNKEFELHARHARASDQGAHNSYATSTPRCWPLRCIPRSSEGDEDLLIVNKTFAAQLDMVSLLGDLNELLDALKKVQRKIIWFDWND